MGYEIGLLDLAGIPVEGLMVMREQYPEIPEDETDRFVVDMLDCGILASFNAIGLVSVDGGFTLNYHVRVSEELGEARRLCGPDG